MSKIHVLALATIATAAVASAFQAPLPSTFRRSTTLMRMAEEDESADTEDTRSDVEIFIEKNYPDFHALLSKNQNIWNELSESSDGYTVFAPNAQAFDDLGEKKRLQLEDPRNLETAQKMGAYHVIATEAVSSMRLRTEDWTKPRPKDGSPPPLTVGGIVTLGGEVPVGRSRSGGLLGFGGKEDGNIVIGPDAKIVQSNTVGDAVVHEVDALISPLILWRYCDQLRIPGF